MNLGNKSQIDLLRSEAEANYSASRWEDSAKTYEHLVGLAQENNDLALAIEFALAAIRAWSNMPDKETRVNKLYQAVGIIGLKKAAMGFEKLAQEAENSDNKKSAAQNYEIAADGFCYILNYDKAKANYMRSANHYESLSNAATKNNDFETSIHLNEKTSLIHSKISLILGRILLEKKELDNNLRKQLLEEQRKADTVMITSQKKIAESHEKLAEFYLKKNEPDYYAIVEKEYQKAISIFDAIGEIKAADKIRETLKKIKKQ